MVVDALTKSGSRSGKCQQKEKETRVCYHCGKAGHLAVDCWQKETDAKMDYDQIKVNGEKQRQEQGQGQWQ